jgi:hypothetical protein
MKILNVIQNQLHLALFVLTRINLIVFIHFDSKTHGISHPYNKWFIRLKISGFEKACDVWLSLIEADYVLKPMDPYFAGLIDTDGSIYLIIHQSNRMYFRTQVQSIFFCFRFCHSIL